MANSIGRAAGIVVKDDKVLLMWRFRNDREYYVIPGGGIEEGEDIEEGLEREIFEELNLKIKNYEKFFEFLNDFTSSRNVPRMDYYFIIKDFEGEVKIGDPELSSQTQQNIYRPEWIEISKLSELNLMPEEAKKRLIEYFKENS